MRGTSSGAREGSEREQPLVVGIAGFSGSGKTTLARELTRELRGTHFPLDRYYLDLKHLSPEERARQNFDHPEALDAALLLGHLAQLRGGGKVLLPEYDFTAHTRLHGGTTVEEHRCLVVEGNFALHYPALRALYDFSVYVETPDNVCYERRLLRDTRERGRSPASVERQYTETVRPMAKRFVRPSAVYADLQVDGTVALDWSVEQVRSALQQRGLLPFT